MKIVEFMFNYCVTEEKKVRLSTVRLLVRNMSNRPPLYKSQSKGKV